MATPTDYLGVFSRTNYLTRYPSAYAANTDPSSLPGEDWVAVYQLSPSHLAFFDSYISPPDDYLFPRPVSLTQIYIYQISQDPIKSHN